MHTASSQVPIGARASILCDTHRQCPEYQLRCVCTRKACECLSIFSTSGVLDDALNLSISLSAGKETKWDSPSNGE